eukprot:CAMPEP_0206216478 /NCGR_PEP_ID=MMETSP0047_2-20121206/2741_1 /ASSEMBLY_ACC=CAM_ASM_000192 /TAXON_ID=195065 /ORGANISM="Chroomonas mesostigmatica_cf, Strain CCMP1168" /LENGTH=267 /DNA_ID=CAMNT_0053638825 /DNA_START=101 /DNA_END=901 /DNA_ORIENTATION=-
MTAAELQSILATHAQEMESLRESADTKILKLTQELSRARKALDADKDVLQDKIDDLQQHTQEQAQKLVDAYKRCEAMAEELSEARRVGVEREKELQVEILALHKAFGEVEASKARDEARRAEEDTQENTRLKTQLEDQVDLARKSLHEAEKKDREEAKAKGENAKVVRSAAAKEAYWDLERLSQELQGKQTLIEEASSKIEELRAREDALLKESQEKLDAQREKAEEEQRTRLAALEKEHTERMERARKERGDREALEEKFRQEKLD